MPKNPQDWTEDRHTSWGKINVTRVSGHANLFRSSLRHHHFISLTINKARVVDSGGAHDFLMDDGEVVEVYMSETQFARMITSIGMGSGAPCTINRMNNESVEDCPAQDRAEFVINARDEHLDGHEEKVRELLGRLQRMLSDKHRPTLKELGEIIHDLSIYVGNFKTSHKYFREQFVEEVEGILDDARSEIEAHILHSAGKLGIDRADLPKLV